jgi:flagellar motor protein MotB
MSVPVVFDGFPAGVTAVNDVFPNLPVSTTLQFENEILTPMVQAETDGQGGFVAVVIIGHSDRQDNVAQFPTPEARRANELAASEARAESAREFLLSQFQAGVQIAGGTIPADFDSATNVAVARFPCGAADLVHTQPASETQRAQNRRVAFFISKFPKF